MRRYREADAWLLTGPTLLLQWRRRRRHKSAQSSVSSSKSISGNCTAHTFLIKLTKRWKVAANSLFIFSVSWRFCVRNNKSTANLVTRLLLYTDETVPALKTRALCVVKQCCRKRALWLPAMLWRRTRRTPPKTLSFSSDATTVWKMTRT